MKFLKSLSKCLVLGFGSLSLCGILAVGVVGKVYEKQAIQLYAKIRDELNKEDNKGIFGKIKNVIKEIKNFDVTKNIDDLKLKFVEIKGFLSSNTSENNNTNNIGSLIKELESIKQTIENNKNLTSLPIVNAYNSEDVKKNLDKAINELKTIQQNTNQIISQIDTNINNFEGSIKEYLDKDSELLRQVDQYTDQINNIYFKISNWMQDATPESIQGYYSLSTTLMIAIPATVLGIGILGSFSSWLKYRNIDGKLYSKNKNKAEKEAIKHIRKIMNKYPSIKNKI